MGRKSKYSKELKVEICKRYLGGDGSTVSLAKELGTTDSIIGKWVKQYNAYGEAAFDERPSNASYSKEFKQMVVDAYLNGEGSFKELMIKYNIPNDSIIYQWVNKYNSHIELKDYIPGGKEIYMTKCRKVTKEERIEIAKYCIKNDLDYQTTCKVYDVTYPNVYNWVKKYREKGEDGLIDKRGKHKSDDEVDEVTLLKRQLKQKEHELEMAQLEVRLLKKLDEIERRRYAEKADMKSNIRQSVKSRKKKKK